MGLEVELPVPAAVLIGTRVPLYAVGCGIQHELLLVDLLGKMKFVKGKSVP